VDLLNPYMQVGITTRLHDGHGNLTDDDGPVGTLLAPVLHDCAPSR